MIALRSSSLSTYPTRGVLGVALAVRESGAPGAPRPRLLDRVREAIRVRHYGRRTEKAYVARAKRSERLPVVLTRDEVRAVIRELQGPPRLMAILLYGAGLRLLECARLRVKDVDFAVNQIVVRGGKGDRDRVTMLPGAVKADLAAHPQIVKRQHEADLQHGAGWVELPWALARKYPNAGREWGWQWVFPATRIYIERGTGQRRRHHLHESVLQRAVKEAAEPESPSARPVIGSAILSQLICSRTATTSEPCRSSWVTGTSARR